MNKKMFKLKRRDGKDAIFKFEKPEGSVWYWDIGKGKSLPLPDVNLTKAKTLKECLDLISKARGQDWVGSVVMEVMNEGRK